MDISSSYKNTNLEFSSDFNLSQGNKLHSNFFTKCYNNYYYFLYLIGTNYQLKRFENTVKNNNLDGLMSTAGITILFKIIYAYCNYYLL